MVKAVDVKNCNSSNNCEEGKENNITVNGISGPNAIVKIYSQPASVNLKFFAYADGNQMPLKKIAVDWGDGKSVLQRTGSFRNNRGLMDGYCDTSTVPIAPKCSLKNVQKFWDPNKKIYIYDILTDVTCKVDEDCEDIDYCLDEKIAANFGQISDRTCDSAFYRYDYTYYCYEGSNNFKQTCNGYEKEFPKGCCVYYPQVQVKDNWGWCNGTCGSILSPGGVGCYDKSQTTNDLEDDECRLKNGPWTPTSSVKVIVAPKK